jgi:hypothetical protein
MECAVCREPCGPLPCSHAFCAACQRDSFATLIGDAAAGRMLNPSLTRSTRCPECRSPLPAELVPQPVQDLAKACHALGARKAAEPALAPACLCGRECKQVPKCPPITPALLPEYAMRTFAYYSAWRVRAAPTCAYISLSLSLSLLQHARALAPSFFPIPWPRRVRQVRRGVFWRPARVRP